jgi:tRNA threonylcarbamoyladenosine biosynthesis protein TsaB
MVVWQLKLIAIDTAGPVIGVGLWDGDRAWVHQERVGRGSEARIAPWVLSLCEEANLSLSDIEGVVVSKGPGGFTALRVGLASGLGIATALGVPVVPVMSLTSRALGVLDAKHDILSVLDARKSRVYGAWFSCDGVQKTEALDVAIEDVLRTNQGPFVAVGEGAIVYEKAIVKAGGVLAAKVDDPRIATLLSIGLEQLINGEGFDAASVRPLYIRPPDAKPPRDLLVNKAKS